MANPIKYSTATNLVTYSEQFDTVWQYGAEITVTPNTTISPTGIQNADTITTSVGSHFIREVITVTQNTVYTFSFYILRGTMTDLKYSIYNLTSPSNIINSTSYYSQTSASVWNRISVTFTTPTGCVSVGVYPVRDSGVTGTCFVWGAQLEKGSVATPYISTTTSSVTVGLTQSNSIKTGNFAVGVNKGGYGPTNVTYFYNGKTPNIGGYTVYVSNGTASPSPFVASNDVNLITLSNQLGGSGITTIAAALNFFNSSSTILCTNMDYPNIVTSGLVVNLDSTYTPSYPKNGITWTDLSGNGNNGTLVNGPSYSNGILFFDGVDDLCRFTASTFTTGSPQNGTFIVDMTFPVLNTTASTVLFSDGGSAGSLIYLYRNTNFAVDSYSWLIYSDTGSKLLGVTYSPGQRYQAAYTFDGLGNVAAYRDGVLITSGTWPVGSTSWNRSGTLQGSIRPSSPGNPGSMSLFLHYNRALSAAEILQNYYAGLQRRIPTNGLVLSLDAENTDKRVSLPSVAYDMSGNNNNGIMLNGTTLSTIGRTSFVLDGANYQISATYSSTFDFSLGQTIILWLKPGTGATASRRNPYSQAYGGSGTITQETFGNFTYYFGTVGIDSSPYTSVASGFTVVPNELAFIAVTRDQATNTTNWYKNAILGNTSTAGGYTTTNNGSLPIKIGTGYAGSFVGNIGQTFVYNRALTSTEISTIYNATRSRYGL